MLRSFFTRNNSWKYRTSGFFQSYFVIGILILSLIFFLYSAWITRRWEKETSGFSMMLANFAAKTSEVADKETSEAGQTIINQLEFPYILTDTYGNPTGARNIGGGLREKLITGILTESEKQQIKKMVADMNKKHTPIPMKGLEQDRAIIGYIYYDQIRYSLNSGSSLVITDVSGEPIFWQNIDSATQNSKKIDVPIEKINSFIENAKQRGLLATIQYNPPSKTFYFHYGNSKLIHHLQWWMPLAQIALVTAFLMIAIIGYQRINRNEQQAIWAGLAKETAHQLGTPISSLMGWLDIIGEKANNRNDDELNSIYKDMENDVQRLRDITARFGEVGSIPKREPLDVSEVAHRAVLYFQKRLPNRQKRVKIIESYQNVPKVEANENLLQWVIENLIRNSLDAIDREDGIIQIRTEYDPKNKAVLIIYRDNGKGIPRKNRNKVFLPGYSTKKHGWGLGLAIVKRIIEGYHGGRVKLANSDSSGTTFIIELPASI
jgi:signal transduction histidine kinase